MHQSGWHPEVPKAILQRTCATNTWTFVQIWCAFNSSISYFCQTNIKYTFNLKNPPAETGWQNASKKQTNQATLHHRLRWFSCLVLPALTFEDSLPIRLILLIHFVLQSSWFDDTLAIWNQRFIPWCAINDGLNPQLSSASLAFVACKVSSSASSFCLSFCNSCASAGAKIVEYNHGLTWTCEMHTK